MTIRPAHILEGAGVVIRTGDLIAVVASADHPLTDQLRAGLDGDPITQLSDVCNADAPDFAALIIGTGDARVFVRGGATVEVDDETYGHDDAFEFFDRRVLFGPDTQLVLRLANAGEPAPWSRLIDGTVPGAGAALATVTSAATASSVSSADAESSSPPEPPTPPHPVASLAAPPAPGRAEPSNPDRVVSFLAPSTDARVDPTPADVPADAQPEHGHDLVRDMVRGIRCQRDHLVHPDARICPLCGDNMQNRSIVVNADGQIGELGPRPPLGVLILPDGRSYQLNRTTVIGRKPDQDPAVQSGTADALAINEANISRVHARVVLDEWAVTFEDLDSANGCAVSAAGGAPIRVDANSPEPLHGATDLYLGSTRIVYQPTSAVPSP